MVTATVPKDPFAEARAVAQKSAKEKKIAKDSLIKELEAHGFYLKEPPKAEDFFTPKKVAEMSEHIFSKVKIPKAEEVDYDLINASVTSHIVDAVKALPPARPGEPGKDAIINEKAIADSVLKQIPKAVIDIEKIVKNVLTRIDKKNNTINLLTEDVKEFINEEISKIPAQRVQIRGSVASIRALTDVNLDALPQDEQGNYILGVESGSTPVNEEPTGAVDNANVTFTLSNTPVADSLSLYFNGQFQRPVVDYTISDDTITMGYAPVAGNMYAQYKI